VISAKISEVNVIFNVMLMFEVSRLPRRVDSSQNMFTMFKIQHELHLWIYYMSKFLNTSEFISMINSRHILNLSIITVAHKCHGESK
jgi:hypothetical protein